MSQLMVLRRIVGLWDSLDAIGPEISAAPLKAQMDALMEEARDVLEYEWDVLLMLAALEPFARMHREGSDPTEHACVRGISSDMTVVTSGDFERAFGLMPTKWQREHREEFA